jgi:pilus assembly protein CpaB
MKTKTLILMLVAVSCGLVASFMTSRYLSASQQSAVVEEEKIPVLVAKKKLAAYTRISDPEMFEVKYFDQSNVTKDAIGDFEKAKTRILRNPLGEGKMLAESDLLDPGQTSPTWKLKPGEVAMAVKTNPDESGAGYMMPGDRVDVQATVTRVTNNQEKPYSKIILQNIEVLAVGQDVNPQEGTVYKEANRVLLRVTHKQAEELALYKDIGTLRLLLRRHDDPQQYETAGARQHNSRLESDERIGASDNLTTTPLPSAPTVPTAVTEVPAEPVKPKKSTLTIFNGGTVKEYEWKHSGEPQPSEKEKK